jgi:hypothetical protein
LPHAAVAVPGWHVPLESQQPWLHVCWPQGFAAPLLEADDPLDELEPPELLTHPPAVHVWVATVQSTHVAPAAPHKVSVTPGWQVPAESQQPLQAAHVAPPLSTPDPLLPPEALPPPLLAEPAPPESSPVGEELLELPDDELPAAPSGTEPSPVPLPAAPLDP